MKAIKMLLTLDNLVFQTLKFDFNRQYDPYLNCLGPEMFRILRGLLFIVLHLVYLHIDNEIL